MSMIEVAIPTEDGDARAFLFTPAPNTGMGEGPWPATILFMDAPAIRPALFAMCERLAGEGYVVLLPDMFWRAGPYGPIDVKVAFTDEAVRREIFERLIPSTNADRSMRDTGAFLNWLLARPEVKGDRVGLTGYCMGAVMSLRAAGTFPERIAASAGFHGGNLATDAADSPHLLAPHIKARVYVGGADQDAGFPPEQADRLREALTLAGVQNTVEIYAGAKHGYAPPDMPVYDEAASERHWRAMLNLFAETLRS